MSLTRLHILESSTDANSITSYEYFRNEELKRFENDPLRVNKTTDLEVKFDHVGRPVIGYGFDLFARPAAESASTLAPYLAAGVVISSAQIAYLEAYRKHGKLNLPGDPLHDTTISKAQFQSKWSNISIRSEAEATKLLNIAASKFEAKVPQSLVANSKERAAVISSSYNLGHVGSKLLAALNRNDRAEAWFEIRYDSNGGASRGPGMARRRYRESDLFGLYGDGISSPQEVEAESRQIMRMYNKHHAEISNEEKAFPPLGGSFQAINLIQPVVSYLSEKYGQGNEFTALNIWVAQDVDGVINRNTETSAGLIIGGAGHNNLVGGNFDDILVAGPRGDVLQGGAGNDKYIITQGHGSEIISDSDGKGTIWIGGSQLPTSAIAYANEANTWEDNGKQYKFRPNTAGTSIGTLTISDGDNGSIVINNFDLDKSQTEGGYLGIHFARQSQVVADVGGNTFDEGNYNPDDASVTATGSVQALTVYASAISDEDQHVTVKMDGNTADYLWNLGDSFRPGGDITLTIPAGSDSVTVGLVYTGTSTSNQVVHLTSTFVGVTDTQASNTLTVTYDRSNPVKDLNGELFADLQELPGKTTNTEDGPVTTFEGQDAGYLVMGSAIKNKIHLGNGNNKILGGDAGNSINVGSGNNSITGGAGNDGISTAGGSSVINAGGGRDAIYTGVEGNGDNLINLNDGSSIVYAGNSPGHSRIYASTQIGVSEAIAQASQATASGAQGNFIMVAQGESTIVGGTGNDVMLLGDGNSLVIAGPGNDTIEGGAYGGGVQFDWSAPVVKDEKGFHIQYANALVMSTGGYTEPEKYDGNRDGAGVALGRGSATIFGGSGNHTIVLGNGNNYVDASTGNSSIWGGNGNDTIFGGKGDVYVTAGGGDDYINAESGDDTIYGGAGNNTIYGGSGNSTIHAGKGGNDWATLDDGNSYVQGGSGNTLIYGSGGDDTLVAGTGNDTIFAGDGDVTIIGGDGSDKLFGGAGTDVIYAGNGGTEENPTEVTAGKGDTTIYGGDGINFLHGGDGENVIYMGDGGTAAAPSQAIAGKGNTTIYGGAGVDYIQGGEGTNVLYAGDGGTAADPTIVRAGAGDTTVYGGTGVDQIFGGTGTNVIYAGDGGVDDSPTVVQLGSGDATVYGGAGVDDITGGSGRNVLYAGDGGSALRATVVRAGSGEATLVGGAGTSQLVGGSGHNTFVLGSGNTTIFNSKAGDVISFGDGISVDGLMVTAQLYDDGSAGLVIEDGNGAAFNVVGGLSDGVDTFQFADGSQQDLLQLMQQADVTSQDISGDGYEFIMSRDDGDLLVGGDGNDTIYGFGANDTLMGGAGLSTLVGGGGNATFAVNANGGQTTIKKSTRTDTLQLGEGISIGEIVASSITSPTGTTSVTLTVRGGGSAGGAGGAVVNVTGNASSMLDKVVLADGSATTLGELVALSSGGMLTVINPDGGHSTVFNDGQGNSSTTVFKADGTKTSDIWSKADGTHGSDFFNSDGSSKGTLWSANGSYSTYVNDGHGTVSTSKFDAQGRPIGETETTSGGVTRTDHADGSYDITVTSSNGSVMQSNYDNQNFKLADSWTSSAGGHGTDVFNHDGSSSGFSYQADGAHKQFNNDGQGHMYTISYDWNGNVTGSAVSTTNGLNNTVTSYRDASNVKIHETWVHGDGTSGTDLFGLDDFNGALNIAPAAGRHVYNDAGDKEFTARWESSFGYGENDGLFYADGTWRVNSSSWFQFGSSPWQSYIMNEAESASGDGNPYANFEIYDAITGVDFFVRRYNGGTTIDTIDGDGNSSHSTRAQGMDGTSSVLLRDFMGNVEVVSYGADGVKIGDIWLHNDGSQGADKFNADGSSIGFFVDAFGKVVNTANGVITKVITPVELPVTFTDSAASTITHQAAPTTYTQTPDSVFQVSLDNRSIVLPGGGFVDNTVSDGQGGKYAYNYSAGGSVHVAHVDGNGQVVGGGTVDTDPGYQLYSVSNGEKSGWNYDVDGTPVSSYLDNGQGTVTTHYYDRQGRGAGYSVAVTDSQGAITSKRYDQDGNPISASFQAAQINGQTRTTYYDTAGHITGSSLTVVDGKGNAVTSNYGVNNVLVSSSTSVVTAENEQTITSFDAAGNVLSAVVTATAGDGTIHTRNYDANGNLVSTVVGKVAESGDMTASNYGADGALSGYVTLSMDSADKTTVTVFDASGTKIKENILNGSSSAADTVYRADGSVLSTTRNSDQSYSTMLNDGRGKITITYFDARNVAVGDSWAAGDGSSGTDTFHADGSVSGTVTKADGSSSTFTRDAQGAVSASHSATDGTVTGSTVTTNDHGNIMVVSFSAEGVKLGDTWSKSDGSSGSDMFAIDGSSSGSTSNPDGTSSTYIDDGHGTRTTKQFDIAGVLLGSTTVSADLAGNLTTVHFDASGFKTDDSWTKSDGTHGSDIWSSDGSHLFTVVHANGSYSTDSLDAQGNQITTQYASDGTKLSDTWIHTDGTSGSNVYVVLNQSPMAVSPIAGQHADENKSYSFSIPSGTFSDPDAGDTLSYSATLSDGTVLPSWLSFDTVTRTFSGTPAHADIGQLAIKVTATDRAGLSVSSSFNLEVAAPAQYIVGNSMYSASSIVLPAPLLNLSGTGSEDISLTGNSAANVITANSGNDTLVAGSGLATLVGGIGNDTFVVNNTRDVIVEQANQGNNSVLTSVSYVLPKHVQNLTGTGSANLTLTGNGEANVIIANSGNDTLVAGTGLATLVGGIGNDTFKINNVDDVIIEQPGNGKNTVITSVSYVLPANVQNMTGTGSGDLILTGNDMNNVITGNAGNTTLVAGAGNATLIAGSGLTTMIGGIGNDVFKVNNVNDVIIEQAGHGKNTVMTTVSYVLPENVQNITATGTADVMLTGNNLDNVIRGNSGNDTLIAGDGNDTLISGTGITTMIGGNGNDVFYVNNVDDVISKQANTGKNTVITTVSYVLPENVQNITASGKADVTLTGNNLNNVITGNAGNDTLIAGSGDATLVAGAGLATLIGGHGNNTFKVNSSNDVIVAQADALSNKVYASASFALSGSLRNLTLTGNAALTGVAGDLSATITGNAGNDTLIGGIGNDTLIAGSGIATLMGGAGSDTYKVNNVSDVIVEQANSDINTVLTSVSYVLPENVQNLTGIGSADLTLTGNGLDNVIIGNAGHDTLVGGSGNSTLVAGSGVATLIGGSGNNTFKVNNVADIVIQQENAGLNTIISSVSYVMPDNVQDLLLTGSASLTATGNSGVNLIVANSGNDTLIAGSGVSVLQGKTGHATLRNLAGAGALLGGSNSDTIIGGAGAAFIDGGAGNDAITLGSGTTVLAFNAGGGKDLVTAGGSTGNTLSLGAGIDQSYLTLSKSGSNLVLGTGGTDSVTLLGWYSSADNHEFSTLQLVKDGAERFDFENLVAQFDQARAQNPTMTKWSVMNGMLNAHLSGDSGIAIGGDLAAYDGQRGNLVGMDLSAAVATMQDPQFGKAGQEVHAWNTISKSNNTLR